MEYPPFSIGNTSSIWVHFPASFVSFPECILRNLFLCFFLGVLSLMSIQTKHTLGYFLSMTRGTKKNQKISSHILRFPTAAVFGNNRCVSMLDLAVGSLRTNYQTTRPFFSGKETRIFENFYWRTNTDFNSCSYPTCTSNSFFSHFMAIMVRKKSSSLLLDGSKNRTLGRFRFHFRNSQQWEIL